MANRDIVVDTGAQQQREMPADTSLVSWVMIRVGAWEDYRKQNFDQKWDEYYRLWRGFWDKIDKSRDSERSRIINPALSQAIESTVAELEEATFGQGKWFDVNDDFNDEDKTDIGMWRDQMNEDLEKEMVPSAISEIFLNGALYGTGIGKITLVERTEKQIAPKSINDTEIQTVDVLEEDTIRVGLTPVHPKEFVIDPTARTIDEALGMAHITTVPKHTVQKKQSDGIYRDVPLVGYDDTLVGSRNETDRTDLKNLREQDDTLITEYHGYVPRNLLEGSGTESGVETLDLTDAEDITVKGDEVDLVEAIVTIANGSTLLKAVENPFVMGDRCFVAYQHDTVPNRFWGRGISEKGYNPQKALDAESRGRIDAMALSIHPMMAMDATRIQRGSDFRVAPGRNVFTNGDPKEILMPFNFGQVNPNTFSQSADLERQVQMGTGAMDSATPLAENRRNETSSGMSIIQGGSVKRSKRTLANIERRFMKPFIHQAAWRFMQFAPDRYPAQDMKFEVHSSLGLVARELEQQQLANMMNTVPPESPAFWMLLKGIYEYSSISNREEMLPIIDQMMQTSLQKQAQPEQPDPLVALKEQEIQIDAQIEQAKIAAKADKDNKDIQIEIARLELEQQKIALKREEMLLDAKIESAKMEQDSLVTAAQMATKQAEAQNKGGGSSSSGGGGGGGSVVNIIEKMEAPKEEPKKPAKRKISVKRTDDGLEGTSEEVSE